jgi:hypothetical protein
MIAQVNSILLFVVYSSNQENSLTIHLYFINTQYPPTHGFGLAHQSEYISTLGKLI